ncbi:hypothetical protein BC832DRAFT_542040 [Gaertneriomyces semiglobifer]|nr:hypothetical protein BC832DRAFT_542040 [Gaertneriomyces semiglobifer]
MGTPALIRLVGAWKAARSAAIRSPPSRQVNANLRLASCTSADYDRRLFAAISTSFDGYPMGVGNSILHSLDGIGLTASNVPVEDAGDTFSQLVWHMKDHHRQEHLRAGATMLSSLRGGPCLAIPEFTDWAFRYTVTIYHSFADKHKLTICVEGLRDTLAEFEAQELSIGEFQDLCQKDEQLRSRTL